MRIIATGAHGMVGSYLPDSVNKYGREDFDVAETLVFERFAGKKTVIHLAAMTDVDLCESEPINAYHTNVAGTANILAMAQFYDTKVIYVSTSQQPITVYARTKQIAEQMIRDMAKDHLIIRAGWMFGGGEKDKKFVGKILEATKAGKDIQAASDIYGCPTYAKDLADFIMNNLDLKGTVNFANGVASRYEVAKFINPNTKPVSSAKFPAAARRMDEVFDDYICPRSWQEALTEYLQEVNHDTRKNNTNYEKSKTKM